MYQTVCSKRYTIILILSALRKLKQLRQTDSYFWSASRPIDKLVLPWPLANVYGNATVDVSPHVHGAKRLWTNSLWGEMSMGRNVHGANRPWGEKSINQKMISSGTKRHRSRAV